MYIQHGTILCASLMPIIPQQLLIIRRDSLLWIIINVRKYVGSISQNIQHILSQLSDFYSPSNNHVHTTLTLTFVLNRKDIFILFLVENLAFFKMGFVLAVRKIGYKRLWMKISQKREFLIWTDSCYSSYKYFFLDFCLQFKISMWWYSIFVFLFFFTIL